MYALRHDAGLARDASGVAFMWCRAAMNKNVGRVLRKIPPVCPQQRTRRMRLKLKKMGGSKKK
jgi:hypothetical protein